MNALNSYCHNSPTKRHHWLLASTTRDGTYPAICKYCPQVRQFGKCHTYTCERVPVDLTIRFRR